MILQIWRFKRSSEVQTTMITRWAIKQRCKLMRGKQISRKGSVVAIIITEKLRLTQILRLKSSCMLTTLNSTHHRSKVNLCQLVELRFTLCSYLRWRERIYRIVTCTIQPLALLVRITLQPAKTTRSTLRRTLALLTTTNRALKLTSQCIISSSRWGMGRIRIQSPWEVPTLQTWIPNWSKQLSLGHKWTW